MIEDVTVDPRVRVGDEKRVYVENHVIRVTDIDEVSAAYLCSEVSLAHQAKQSYLPIIINSSGGNIEDLWSMVDVLMRSKIPIVTIIEGKAYSSAIALFMCGWDGYRFVSPNSSVMIHDGSGGREGKALEVKTESRELNRQSQKLYRFLAKRAKQPKDYFSELIHERGRVDWYLTPTEAVQHGLADRIKVPTLKTEIKVTTSLVFSR